MLSPDRHEFSGRPGSRPSGVVELRGGFHCAPGTVREKVGRPGTSGRRVCPLGLPLATSARVHQHFAHLGDPREPCLALWQLQLALLEAKELYLKVQHDLA